MPSTLRRALFFPLRGLREPLLTQEGVVNQLCVVLEMGPEGGMGGKGGREREARQDRAVRGVATNKQLKDVHGQLRGPC